MQFTTNMCHLDRAVRTVIAIALAYAALFHSESLQSLIIIGLIMCFALINFLAAALGFCPVYCLAGVSTVRKSMKVKRSGV